MRQVLNIIKEGESMFFIALGKAWPQKLGNLGANEVIGMRDSFSILI